MSEIDAKWEQLRARGLDLGEAKGPERDAGYGGRVRDFSYGQIYWHRDVDGGQPHEVHGGILGKFLELGGVDFDPRTGRRDLGFPVSDECVTSDRTHCVSRFQWGSIFWNALWGAHVLWAPFRDWWESQGRGARGLDVGYPICDPISVDGQEAALFEFGSALAGPALGAHVVGTRHLFPRLGRPAIVSGGEFLVRLPFTIQYSGISVDMHQQLRAAGADSMPMHLWTARMVLRPVSRQGGAEIVPVSFEGSATGEGPGLIPMVDGARLLERTLYDVCLQIPEGLYPISQHSIYVCSNWDNFGIAHITDLHISRRNEGFRQALVDAGETEGAEQYSNAQDNLRDFIRVANRLHRDGGLDIVVATGDLVDYVFEKDEEPSVDFVFQGRDDDPPPGNWSLLREILLGRAPSPNPQLKGTEEELELPIFLGRGNHDRRPFSYDLDFRVEWGKIRGFDAYLLARRFEFYRTHNLTWYEAAKLQGRPVEHTIHGGMTEGTTSRGTAKSMSKEEAHKQVLTDVNNRWGSQTFFRRYLSDRDSHIVELGPHRLVLLDTGAEAGVPDDAGLMTLLALWADIGTSREEDYAAAGRPYLRGLDTDQLGLIDAALRAASPDGAVIVALHAPPFEPMGHEINHYFRESERQRDWSTETLGYLRRRKLLQFDDGKLVSNQAWPSGQPYFYKSGDMRHGMDDGTFYDMVEEFLLRCTENRHIDLVLCGHARGRIDYRVTRDAGEFRVFTDFYTDNPSSYYSTRHAHVVEDPASAIAKRMAPLALNIKAATYAGLADALKDETVHVMVTTGADPTREPTVVRDHRQPWAPYLILGVPPYPAPLNESDNSRAWWRERGCLVLQTAPLGTISENQRIDRHMPLTDYPDPTFQGFRVIEVTAGAISAIHYVRLADLRAADYQLPWHDGVHGFTKIPPDRLTELPRPFGMLRRMFGKLPRTKPPLDHGHP